MDALFLLAEEGGREFKGKVGLELGPKGITGRGGRRVGYSNTALPSYFVSWRTKKAPSVAHPRGNQPGGAVKLGVAGAHLASPQLRRNQYVSTPVRRLAPLCPTRASWAGR